MLSGWPELGGSPGARFQESQSLQPVPEQRVWPRWHVTRAGASGCTGFIAQNRAGLAGDDALSSTQPFSASSFCQLLDPFQILLLPKGDSSLILLLLRRSWNPSGLALMGAEGIGCFAQSGL